MPGNEAFLRPDTYVFEGEVGGQAFQPSGTSAAGFVDVATWGPIGEAIFISSPADAYRKLGSDFSKGHLMRALKNFFAMGGQRCYVVRTSSYANITDPTSYTATEAQVILDDGAEPTPTNLLTVTAKYPGTRGNGLSVVVENVDGVAHTFDFLVRFEGQYVERYENVTFDDSDTDNFIEYRVNVNPEKQWRGSQWITVEYLPETVMDPVADTYELSGGTDGDSGITASDYVGDAAAHNGVYAFDRVDEIVNICHPGNTATEVILGGLNYVYNHPYTKPPRTNLYVYDLPLGLSPQEALTFVHNTVATTTGYEAVYYPWVKVGSRYDPVAPYMLGIFAKNDLTRGVWQAPAGANFPLPVTGLAYDCTLGDQETLSPRGINTIVKQSQWGFLPWGARTLRVHTHFRHLNVRRFTNLIKKTLYQGGKQFVFELNAPKTWRRVQESAEMLLAYYYSLGAFAGKTRAESYYAKCDEDTNPPELIEQGVLTCEVGICPVKPAEFVVFNVLLYNEGALPLGDSMSLLTD